MLGLHRLKFNLCFQCLASPFQYTQLFASTVGGIASLGKSKKSLKGKGAGTVEKVRLPVETDAKNLVKYLCGSNLLAEGGQDIELKPDNEYPDWLWNLHIGKNKSLDELDPNTLDYWQKVRSLAIRRNHRLKKGKKF